MTAIPVHGGRLPKGNVRVAMVALAVLVAGIGAQFIGWGEKAPLPLKSGFLGAALPAKLAGWSAVDEPLGRSEAASQSALKTLNLDDYVLRRFQRGGTVFTVYVAYWAAGRMPIRSVASHTPDRCWTENGLRCLDMEFRKVYRIGERDLRPAEYRVFAPEGGSEKTYVIYWHLVGGELYNYGGRFNAIPHPWLWWRDVVTRTTGGARDQLFVRVTSNTPLAALWPDMDFRSVMATVANLGLWEAAR